MPSNYYLCVCSLNISCIFNCVYIPYSEIVCIYIVVILLELIFQSASKVQLSLITYARVTKSSNIIPE